MGKVIIVIATVIAVLLGGYFIAVRVNPALAGGDVAAQSLEGEDEEADTDLPADDPSQLTGRATISGVVTKLSNGGGEGFFLLRVVGKGYLPIHIGDSLEMPGLGQSLIVSVPENFDSSDDNDEQFDRLRQLADDSGSSLEVVAFE
jgi:hypothetical protein